MMANTVENGVCWQILWSAECIGRYCGVRGVMAYTVEGGVCWRILWSAGYDGLSRRLVGVIPTSPSRLSIPSTI